MKTLIKLAAASLIGMSGLTASATTVAKTSPKPANNKPTQR